jgi:hypothetical protein
MVGAHIKVDRWKAMINYPNPAYLCMTVRGGIPTDLSDGVGKVYNLCRVKFYSNNRVLGHRWLGRPLPSPMSVLFSKVDFGKVEKCAERSTRRVLPWQVLGSEYL